MCETNDFITDEHLLLGGITTLCLCGCFSPALPQERSEHPSFWTHQTQIFPKGIQMPHSLQCKLFPSWHAQGIWATPCLSKISLLGTLALFPKKPWRAADCASPDPNKGKTALHSPHCRLQGLHDDSVDNWSQGSLLHVTITYLPVMRRRWLQAAFSRYILRGKVTDVFYEEPELMYWEPWGRTANSGVTTWLRSTEVCSLSLASVKCPGGPGPELPQREGMSVGWVLEAEAALPSLDRSSKRILKNHTVSTMGF